MHGKKPLKKRERRIAKAAQSELPPDSDDNFSFIAGYTSGGAAFGVPWEEKENPFRFGQIDPEDVEDEREYPF
jgi:hypothetical protein